MCVFVFSLANSEAALPNGAQEPSIAGTKNNSAKQVADSAKLCKTSALKSAKPDDQRRDNPYNPHKSSANTLAFIDE